MPMIELLLLTVFPLAMIAALVSDVSSYIIPNLVSIALAIAFPALAFMCGMGAGTIGLHLAIGFGMLALGAWGFSYGFMGGGDAKLLGATAIWMGASQLMPYLFVTALVGGALTILLLMFRKLPMPGALAKRGWVMRLHDPKEGVPYGVALAIGGMFVYTDTTIFHLAVA